MTVGARALSADAAFGILREHVAPGTALGAKLLGLGAVEVEADGAVVTCSDGRELLDFGSYAVTLLGHRPVTVVAAVRDQLERMPAATRVLANPVVAEFVAALAGRTGSRLERVWLGSDGADAVEVAIKLARRGTGRPRVLAARRAFHGKTAGALALTANPAFRAGIETLLSHTTHVDPGDPDAVGREVAAGDVAAVIFEPIQGEAGVHVLDADVLAQWTADAHAAGAYVISDEIQAGLRRCGPFSPSLHAGLEPDAVLFGKALGGGVMPLAAMVATPALHAPLHADPTWHTSTFGGHPLACAAGVATLAEIETLAPAAEQIGAQLADGLRALARARPDVIHAVRGRGLLWGVECANAGVAGSLLLELAHRGLLVSPCLSSPATIRLMPPRVASARQIRRALELLAQAVVQASDFVAVDRRATREPP